jgi:hypothetical protein
MERTYLYVPFEEHDDARRQGALWDADAKCWYISANEAPSRFRRWLGLEVSDQYAIVSDQAYIACAQTSCCCCAATIEVICVYCNSGLIDGERYRSFSVSNILVVDAVLSQALERWPSYHLISHQNQPQQFANHCPRCAAAQPDYLLHDEPQGVFFTLDHDTTRVHFIALNGRVQLNGDESLRL